MSNIIDVGTCLRKLNPNKSVGLDGVHPMLLKELHVELLDPQALLF